MYCLKNKVMKNYKETPRHDFRSCKSPFVSRPSDSCMDSKSNWKHCVSESGNIFYIKYNANDESITSIDRNGRSEYEIGSSDFKLCQDVKEVTLTVNSLDRYRFGRRSSIIESMLGFKVVAFPDNAECLMVGNIIDKCLKTEYPYVKEGDWFKSLENIEVRASNIDKLLLQYVKATKVTLVFEGSCTKMTKEKDVAHEINNFDDFACMYKQSFESKVGDHDRLIFLTLIISRDSFEVNNTEFVFYYPYVTNNFLYKSKGSFLTLHSVIKNDLKSNASQSSIIVDGTKYYIVYGYVNYCTLVVCAFSSCYQSRKAANCNGNDFINFLKFNISEHSMLDFRHLGHVCDILKINIEHKVDNCFCNLDVETSLSSSYCIALPKEAQLRISDALSELESMDYKKWNEGQTNRHLVVCGSSLYFKKYLLKSNLPSQFRTMVECFLRIRGIADFFAFQNIKEMYIWEKMEQSDDENKHFLAICMHNYLLLVVVLKSTPLTKPNIHCLTYIDEITDTINYLVSCGIESVSQFWLNSNKRPSTNLNKSGSQLLRKFDFIRQKNISSENIDKSYALRELLHHSIYQGEEVSTKKSERDSLDWEVFGNKNQFGETLDQICYYNAPLLNEVQNIKSLNLTTGWSNDLKFFVHLNFVDGEILQPFIPLGAGLKFCIIKEHILAIHEVLRSNPKWKNMKDTNYRQNSSIVKEHSISFELVNNSGEKEIVVLIGRRFSFPLKEVYLCLGQNISQSVVELSFRMSFLNIG